MKKVIIIALMLTWPVLAFPQSMPAFRYHQTDWNITQSDQYGFTLQITFPDPEFRKVAGHEGYFELMMDGCYPAVEQGKPNLPSWNRMIELPLGATFTTEVLDLQMATVSVPSAFAGLELVPVQPPRPKSGHQDPDWVKDAVIYASGDWFGFPFTRIEDEGIMRNARIARLMLSPLEYHTGARALRIIRSATIRVTFSGGIQDPVSWKGSYASPFTDATTYTLNSSAFVPPTSETPVKYLILSDPQFQTALQPFIQWKKIKGFEVMEVYTGSPGVGTTTTSIKSYLQGLWNAATPANPAPVYLLIVGDVQQVPAFNGTTGSHSTDLYYAEFTNDTYPDMYYGRFSATNVTQLQPQIDKTLHVERYLMTQPGYLQNMILVAGNDASFGPVWANGQMNYAHDVYVNATNNLTPHLYLYPTSSGQVSQIIQKFNDGASIVNYTAHGSTSGWSDPAFTSTTVATLTNTGKYPTVISNACQTNTYSINQCFGEALLRALDKGAVGHIGASNNTFWDEDYHFSVGVGPIVVNPSYAQTGPGFYDRLFHTHGEPFPEWAVTQGAIIRAGNMAVTQSASSVDYYWEVYHLMGDPSLMPYLGVPSAITPTFPATLPTGLSQVTIQSNPYGYVAISANGMLHGAGLADATGFANISIIPFTLPTTALLVITGQNKIPFIDSIMFVSPTGPYVLADSISFRDVTGNFNQSIDAGESIQMDIRLKNYTPLAAGSITAKLIINDPYVILTDSVLTISGLPGQATSFALNAFSFQLADFIPDQHFVPGLIRIQEGASNTWDTPCSFYVNSPVVKIRSVRISDAPGNNNGKIEPGESFEFIVRVENTGHAGLAGLNVTLDQNSNYVQLGSTASVVAQFGPGNYYDVAFPANAATAPLPKGSMVQLFIRSSKNDYADSLLTFKMLDVLREDFETNGFTAYPWTLTGSQPWFTTTENPYEGSTCAKSGAIPNQSSTSMSLQMPVISHDSISFVYKVSSEEGYDVLLFLIDQTEVGKWSGEKLAWTEVKFPVDSGLRTFTWTYQKDYYWQEGQDCAWIDYIIFPPTSLYTGTDAPRTTPLSLQVYPNPTRGNLNIVIREEAFEGGTMKLLGSDGRVLERQNLSRLENTMQLDIGRYPAGMYMLLIETPAGNHIRKIIRY